MGLPSFSWISFHQFNYWAAVTLLLSDLIYVQKNMTKVVLVTLAIFCLETLWLSCTVEQAHFCAWRFLTWRYKPFPCPYDILRCPWRSVSQLPERHHRTNLLKFRLLMDAQEKPSSRKMNISGWLTLPTRCLLEGIEIGAKKKYCSERVKCIFV